MSLFTSLANFEPTRKTLHLYSQAIGAIPRTHGIAHPKWWHISLNVRPEGLSSDNIPLPDGGILTLRLDFHQHNVVLATSRGETRTLPMAAGLTGTQMGDSVITAVAEFGLYGEVARTKFENTDPRTYDPAQAEKFFNLLVEIERIFKTHQRQLPAPTGPVQLWPHGFDLAFEWFGSRTQTVTEHGRTEELPAQLNLGFYPGNEGIEPYFYSNPWPFAGDVLLGKPLPQGARWHTDSWEGSMLPYAGLVDDPQAESRLLEYARAVYDLAAPTLTT